MDGFADVTQWHDWWWLWAVKEYFISYHFRLTTGLYCRQINDALSIIALLPNYTHTPCRWGNFA